MNKSGSQTGGRYGNGKQILGVQEESMVSPHPPKHHGMDFLLDVKEEETARWVKGRCGGWGCHGDAIMWSPCVSVTTRKSGKK